MGYVEKNLLPGESVLYKTGPHWIVLVLPILASAIPGLGGLILAVAPVRNKLVSAHMQLIFGLVLIALATIQVIGGLVKRSAIEIAVTNKRVVIKKGLATRATQEILLSKIESIHIEEPLWGRLLGYGTVIIRGTGGTPDPFDLIAHPLEFRRQVEHQIEINEQKGG
jgi:uncharacterized membrane protein YdbT with pleckstrin-like domain